MVKLVVAYYGHLLLLFESAAASLARRPTNQISYPTDCALTHLP